MPEPRKHHLVPQSLLRAFSRDAQRRQIHAFDKTRQSSFVLAIRDACSEKDFYRVVFAEREINFETAFQEIDDLLAEILEVVNNPGLQALDNQVLSKLPALVTAQLLRTKLQRTTSQEIARQLRAFSEEAGLQLPPDVTDDEARRISFRALIGADGIQSALESKDAFILEARGQTTFWISDNPVVIHNSFPYGKFGVGAVGIEIYIPVSPTRVLALFCPSIRKQIAESLDPNHPRHTLESPLFGPLLKGITTKGVVAVQDDYVQLLNELQVRQSSRFLFSSTDEFGFAREILEVTPQLATVSSLLNVGRMGEGPPRRDAMPGGEWLVVESGTNHHAIPVETIRDLPLSGIVFEPRDYAKLRIAAQDGPFDLATLYQDGREVHGMREVTFDYLMFGERRVVHLRHVDTALNALLQRLNRH